MSVDQLSVLEEQAARFSSCAIEMGEAYDNRADQPNQLLSALKDNLDAWVVMRTIAEKIECGLSDDVKANMVQLSSYVASKTFECAGQEMPSETMETLVNINLQISEGLLEAKLH